MAATVAAKMAATVHFYRHLLFSFLKSRVGYKANSKSWPLVVNGGTGAMFGGMLVNVSGPCFQGDENITCKFGDTVSLGHYWGNMMQAMCIQPVLYVVGAIKLYVSTDGGETYDFSATYRVGRWR